MEFPYLLGKVAMIILKEVVKALAKELINRRKKGTAPTANRDGSGNT